MLLCQIRFGRKVGSSFFHATFSRNYQINHSTKQNLTNNAKMTSEYYTHIFIHDVSLCLYGGQERRQLLFSFNEQMFEVGEDSLIHLTVDHSCRYSCVLPSTCSSNPRILNINYFSNCKLYLK